MIFMGFHSKSYRDPYKTQPAPRAAPRGAGMARSSSVWLGPARYGSVRLGMARSCFVWLGLARYGSVWLGLARSVCLALARSGSAFLAFFKRINRIFTGFYTFLHVSITFSSVFIYKYIYAFDFFLINY